MPKVKKYALLMLIPFVGFVFWILTIIEAFKHKETKVAGILLIFAITSLVGWILILASNVKDEEQNPSVNVQPNAM